MHGDREHECPLRKLHSSEGLCESFASFMVDYSALANIDAKYLCCTLIKNFKLLVADKHIMGIAELRLQVPEGLLSSQDSSRHMCTQSDSYNAAMSKYYDELRS